MRAQVRPQPRRTGRRADVQLHSHRVNAQPRGQLPVLGPRAHAEVRVKVVEEEPVPDVEGQLDAVPPEQLIVSLPLTR